ncbi:glycosyl hydrolase [bacterium]|nr:MAG: glycosyl hydrolase [bacterium]
MVEIRNRRLLIDEKPTLVFAGELHYFRLRREEWEDRVRKLKHLGCNAVASYIPWIVHEQRRGEFELADVADFMDLCHRHGLWFIPRPGPFVMAEMKNEGIPHWVYREHPDAVPVSWRGERQVTPILDYLNEGFLGEVERWYGAVMPLVASRLHQNGGPVIGVQLDNEIGMLTWVTNQPDLSDDTLCDFAKWIVAHDEKGRYPFDLNDPVARIKGFREPTDGIGPCLLQDYGSYERDRFARYVSTLRGFAERSGVTGVPFIVNVHGSGGGRGTMFPIGIHQLYESYQGAGYLSGSDHYLGELTRENAQDLYYLNAFMSAAAPSEQPIASMEFEVGSGDYGETGGSRMSGAAADMKVRLSLVQGNRLLNYYLLAGGRNPLLKDGPGDGNDRIGNNGERHGFAAPIDPEGKLSSTYAPLKDTTEAMLAVADKLADMDEEHDDLALAFVPDYYKTDLHRPGAMRQIVENLEGVRGNLESLTRTLLFLGYRFPAVDLQNRPIEKRALVFASSRHLSPSIQRKLVSFVEGGGSLLVYGELPYLDMEGQPCTVLSDAMGVRHREYRQGSGSYFPSLRSEGEPEVRTWRCETFEVERGDAFVRLVQPDEAVGVECRIGAGKAIVLGCSYPLHPPFFQRLFGRLGLSAALHHDDPDLGVLMTTVRNHQGERFLNLINLNHEEKRLRMTERGKPLFDGNRVVLAGRQSRLLPIGVRFGNVTVDYATTELVSVTAKELRFRATGTAEVLRAGGKLMRQAAGKETRLRFDPL